MLDIDHDEAAPASMLDAAMAAQSAGDLATALARYRVVIDRRYRVAEILPIVANLTAQGGALAQAVDDWTALLAIEPGHAVALQQKGLLCARLGQHGDALDCLAQACRADPDNAVAANNHAVLLSNASRKTEALAEFTRALALQPDNVQIRHQIRRLSVEQVPFWHIPMMNDVRRNDAFQAAIEAALAATGPGAHVLDIGSGSGLLSMMAARAGAGGVTTCEAVPIIAEAARQIIADNGYADRIELFALPSTDLMVGTHLPAPADILVSEILSSDLLTENVLDTFEDAHARLLRPEPIVIPRAASAIGCLVESEVLTDYIMVDRVSGFDLSHFSRFAPPKLPIHGTMTGWRRLSADVELVRIDLTAKRYEPQSNTIAISVTADGIAVGIVQWMHVDLAENIAFENHPDTYTDGGWLQVLHGFPAPIQVRTGDLLHVHVGHDRVTLIVMPATG